MKDIIKKSVLIVNLEGFNGLRNRIILNFFIITLLTVLQFQDIGTQIIGNYFSVIWISINSYYICTIFLKGNKSAFLLLSRLSNSKKFFLLFSVSFIINIPYLFYIIIQLFFLKAGILQIIYISMLQYIFGIIFGIITAFFYKKNIGIGMVILLGFLNFFKYNIYSYDAYNHLFSISEMLYSVNSTNITNILGFMLMIIFGIFFSVILMDQNNKYKKMKIITLIISLLSVYLFRLYIELLESNKIEKEKYKVVNVSNQKIYYKGISEAQAKNLGEIEIYFEEEYNKITGTIENRKIFIKKLFLTDILWTFKKNRIFPITFKDNVIQINVLSDSMMNFNNFYLLKNFIEETEKSFINKNYDRSNKYINHLLEGFSIIVKKNIGKELKSYSGNKIEEYYNNDLKKIFLSPSNKNNFIKRIAMLIYDKYPEKSILFFQIICKNKPKNDKEFLILLKNNFIMLYNDKDVKNVIKEAKVEIKL